MAQNTLLASALTRFSVFLQYNVNNMGFHYLLALNHHLRTILGLQILRSSIKFLEVHAQTLRHPCSLKAFA